MAIAAMAAGPDRRPSILALLQDRRAALAGDPAALRQRGAVS